MSDHEEGLRAVGETAELLGLSVRTLHHWEERGIVAPSERSESNYRLYSEENIARLQQAMIYRATGMSLETIKTLLDAGSDKVTHLRRRKTGVRQTSGRSAPSAPRR